MENATSYIRNKLREQRNQERQERRCETLNSIRRALGVTNVGDRLFSSAEIEILANQLKCKKITLNGIKTLKQAFIQSEENIRTFLIINGALHALVREATGNKTQHQLEAINCCCNLALGNEKAGVLVAKAVAPYIISQLDSYSQVFLDICLWTLGNLAGSGEKTWSILKSQGVLPKFLQLCSIESIAESAVYAVTLYTKTGFTLLEDHEFESIAVIACQLMVKEESAYWLVYLLTCSEKCDLVMLKNSVVSNAFKSLKDTLKKDCCGNDKKIMLNVTALLRIIGNLCGAQYTCFEELLQGENRLEDLRNLFGSLLVYPLEHIRCESLWVIGNVVKHLTEPEFFLSGLEPGLNDALKTLKQIPEPESCLSEMELVHNTTVDDNLTLSGN